MLEREIWVEHDFGNVLHFLSLGMKLVFYSSVFLLALAILLNLSSVESKRSGGGGGGRGRSSGGYRRSSPSRVRSTTSYSSTRRTAPYSKSSYSRPRSRSYGRPKYAQKYAYQRKNYVRRYTGKRVGGSASPRSHAARRLKGSGRRVGGISPSEHYKSVGARPSYTYRLDLGGGRKYVGRTANPRGRISRHFSGRGAKYTRVHSPKGVDYVRRHYDELAAKRAETREYYKAKRKYGDGVRGAGHTRSDDY